MDEHHYAGHEERRFEAHGVAGVFRVDRRWACSCGQTGHWRPWQTHDTARELHQQHRERKTKAA